MSIFECTECGKTVNVMDIGKNAAYYKGKKIVCFLCFKEFKRLNLEKNKESNTKG